MRTNAPEESRRSYLVRGAIGKGAGVIDSFLAAGIPSDIVGQVTGALKREGNFDFRTRRPGERFAARINEDGTLRRFTYAPDLLSEIVVEPSADGTLSVRRVRAEVETNTVVLTGTIKDSFYSSILSRGELPKLAAITVGVFEYDIDFVQDVRDGDSYRIFLERITHNGRVVDYGRIHAAEYVGEVAGTVRGYWFPHENKDIEGFYNEKGQRLKKFFLRAPLDVLRVTSRFGMRFHPIVKRKRMHSGIDYGAPTGTPVWAVADGTVASAGRAGGYGNLISIRHPGGLISRYGHLSKILVRTGQSVRQRQFIGRVGTTGLSTGPHLHYELLLNGRPVNPVKVKTGEPKTISGQLMPKLQEVIRAINEEWEKATVVPEQPPVAADAQPPED